MSLTVKSLEPRLHRIPFGLGRPEDDARPLGLVSVDWTDASAKLWSAVSRRTLVVGMAASAWVCLFATACDEPDQVHIILAAPYAGKANPAGSERVLSGARARLREHGFVRQAGAPPEPAGERWLWHEGNADALETRLASSDDGITITLRQVEGERGSEFQVMMNELSGVVSACMTTAASPHVSAPTPP